ncbi:hypothetical protein HPB48_002189 [Haemaphysalis longicornis]|uniref:Uncharacterized protein n=1 Tax=Haemaphysalis longicornis TaxID=44386 RepID=A0A9J6FH06_HAELO|nr:hypothetical protein HPB48_002189 [Haemaphysalis longicornis]
MQRVQYRTHTHIFKDSLGGSDPTVMIAATSPSKLSFSETHSTRKLKRAMTIQLQGKRNILSAHIHVHMAMYNGVIGDLKRKIMTVSSPERQEDEPGKAPGRLHAREP